MTLAADLRGSWQQFLETFEGLRPELYRYCRHLMRSPWDAEDLAQDVLTRAFVTLGKLGTAPPNPRAWLFRVASNAWIDQQRRPRVAFEREPDAPTDPRDTREAAGTLSARPSCSRTSSICPSMTSPRRSQARPTTARSPGCQTARAIDQLAEKVSTGGHPRPSRA
jgi:RNA polymerase sigma-70 factor (ECF subfamily)